MPRLPSSPQITSKGCSRGFILCVLYRALDYVRQRQMLGHTVQFPFCNEEISRWLLAAQGDCSISEQAYQDGLGGTFYDEADTSTYWTQPQQFCTWWKNNVERKNKFLLLQRDAAYDDNDDKQIARAAYCRNAIAISLSIKNNFHRYLPSQGDTNIVQYIIPYPMPVHMTRASLPSLDKTGHLHAPENTNVCVAQMITPTPQPMGKRVDVAAPATPILPRRIKRPYNKKTPQRLSTHFTSQIGNFPSPCLNHQSAPSANQFAQMFSPSVHYARKPSILSPKTTTVAAEEASSDSGTDDDFFCGDPNILHFADDSSALCEGASAGRKRKAQDRSPFSHDQLMPCGSGSGSSSSSHTLNAYSTPFLLSSTMPTHLATLSPFVSSSFSLPAAYQSSSYAPSPSLLPSSYSSPTPCPASVPADLNIQQYYHIEEEQTPYMQPPVPCAYIPFDDDQECFSLKLPDDPFLLEFSNDYFSSESKFPNCFKDSYSDMGRKEPSRSQSVVSPSIGGDSLSKPSMTHAVSLSHMHHILSCSPYTDNCDVSPSFIQNGAIKPIPWQEPQVPTNPHWYLRDQISQSNDFLSMKGQHLLSNGNMILIKNQLSSKKIELSKVLTELPETQSPLLMKRFEEDIHMISMISQTCTAHQNFSDNCNKAADQIYSINVGSTTDMDERVIEFSSSSSYPSPVTSFCSPSVLDIADYSLLDDGYGDDYDLLTYFGIKSSRWTIQDCAESSSEDDWTKGKDDN